MRPEVVHSRTINIEATLLSVPTEHILKLLQVPVEKADNHLLDQIELYREKSLRLSRPCASYTLYKNPRFIPESGELVLSNTTFSLGNIVLQALKKSTNVAFFVCSCGERVEQFSKQLMSEGHTLEGYIVDLIGSEFAEKVADIVHKTIGNDMKKDHLNITNRYSPGYCSWPVSDQRYLFSLMDNTCGVKLKPSSMMIPIKSVSGIVGIGSDVRFRGYTCSRCTNAFCIYRDKK